MIRAYALRIFLFGLIGLLIGLGIAVVTPPKYEAIMQILVDQRPALNTRPMTEAEDGVSDLLESTGPRTVQTQVEILTGYGVLSKAAESVASRRGKSIAAIPELADLKGLMRAVTLEAVTGSDLITIRVKMGDPKLAQEFATEVYNAFYERNVDSAREVGQRAITTLEGQVDQARKQLAAVDAEIEAYRRKNKVSQADVLLTSEAESLKQYGDLLETARIELVSQESNLAGLRAQLAGTPKTIVAADNVAANPTRQTLEQEVASARVSLRQLLATWEEGAQPVQVARERLKRLEAELARAEVKIDSGTSSAPNPVYQTLQQQLSATSATLNAAREKYRLLSEAYSRKIAERDRLPVVLRGLEEMQRRQDTYNRIYQSYQQRLDTLKLADRGRLTTPTVVTPAIAFPDAVWPNYPLCLGAGLIGGLLLGVLSAFNQESRRSPIRTLSQLNRLTLEPAFRSIPELPFVGTGAERSPEDVFLSLLGNFVRNPKRPYRLGVMGVDLNNGASVTASSMALAASLESHGTLLVDSARERGAASRLGITGSRGEPNANLSVLRLGGEDLVNLNGVIAEVQGAEEGKSLVVFDLQPFRGGSNPVLFLAGLDECILLVRAGKTRTVDFLQAQQMLMDAGIPQVTVVLARAKSVEDDFTLMRAEAPGPALGPR